MTLTPRQRAELRSQAHPLKPIVQVGKDGLTEWTLQSILEAFNTRELLKVKVQQAAPLTAAEAAAEMTRRLEGVEHVQTIGRTVVLYRKKPDTP